MPCVELVPRLQRHVPGLPPSVTAYTQRAATDPVLAAGSGPRWDLLGEPGGGRSDVAVFINGERQHERRDDPVIQDPDVSWKQDHCGIWKSNGSAATCPEGAIAMVSSFGLAITVDPRNRDAG